MTRESEVSNLPPRHTNQVAGVGWEYSPGFSLFGKKPREWSQLEVNGALNDERLLPDHRQGQMGKGSGREKGVGVVGGKGKVKIKAREVRLGKGTKAF